eukprot:scaffold765_cov151-Chaetoceros_neogracile.AAC.18
MTDYDHESVGGESWMDASIRLHLSEGARTGMIHFSNTAVDDDDDGDDDNDETDIITPPETNASFESYEHHHPNDWQFNDRNERRPIVIAELVSTQSLEDKVDIERVSISATAPPLPQVTENHGEDKVASSQNTQSTTDASRDQHPIDTFSTPERESSPSLTPAPNPARTQTRTIAPTSQHKRVTAGNKNRKKGKKNNKRFKTSASVSKFIVTRTSLPYTIEHNEMTLEWTAIINTNQEALDNDDIETIEESTVCMTFKTLDEAREACHSYAPPRMHSSQDTPKCHICTKKFNKFLRRPSHCKNCGVCVCNCCTVHWPKDMLPVTYHMNKRKKMYKVCMGCDWLNGAFRQACVTGDLDKAIALQATGNVNTRTLFANVRGEHYFPVHCAVLGGNLAMFKWFIETLKCPINPSRRKPSALVQVKFACVGNDPVLSSKGKAVLDLAMEAQELGILYYLIIEKGVSVMQYRNLRVALRTLEATLLHLPAHLTETA